MSEYLLALQTDANGRSVQLSPTTETELVSLRAVSDLTIANAATLNNFNSTFPNGCIPVKQTPIIYLYLYIEFGTGPLTQVQIQPRFGFAESDDLLYRPIVPSAPSSGAITINDQLIFNADVENEYIIVPILNPGAALMQIWTESTGAVAGSSLIMGMSRGFSPHPGYVA